MIRITDNSQLEVGKWYWMRLKDQSGRMRQEWHASQVKANRFSLDPEVKYLGDQDNKMWCYDGNSQALKLFDIYGPISQPTDGIPTD